MNTWNQIVRDSQILAVHGALLYTGEVLYFSGSQHDPRNAHSISATRLWNPETNNIEKVPSPGRDLFCCGHAFLADGRLLVAGGTSHYPNDLTHNEHTHYRGIRDVAIFDPNNMTNPWSTATPMHSEPIGTSLPRPYQSEGGGRWYPTLLTLPDGRIFTMSGHPEEEDSRHNNFMIEIFNPMPAPLGSWEDMGDEMDSPNSYPRLHLLPNGHVFCVRMDSGRSMEWDQATWRSVAAFPQEINDFDTFEMSSVLLPLVPDDNYNAHILVVGPAQPIIISLNQAPPIWRSTNLRTLAGIPVRKHCNTVLLPDGTVLVIGGLSSVNDDSSAVKVPELYSPADGSLPGLFNPPSDLGPSTDHWRTMERTDIARGYHSVALLLSNGSVWVAGSNINGDYSWDNRDSMGHFLSPTIDNIPDHQRRELRIEVFNPPYMFRERPVIFHGPETVRPGTRFDIDIATDVNNIYAVAIMRCGSVTHGFNVDQRYVGLRFERTETITLHVEAPPDNNIAPPGYYLLFVIGRDNSPSEGWFVQVEGVS